MKIEIIAKLLAAVLLVIIASGCWLIHPERSTAGRAMFSAAAYLGTLQTEGKLTGIAKGEHFSFESVPLKVGLKQPQINSLMLKLTPENKRDTLFWYQVKRVGQDDPWQLIKAWRSDARGSNSIVIFPETQK